MDPQHARSRSLLALVLNEQGRFREGLAEFRHVVRGIEDHGGAPDVYGTEMAAGAAPAPRPSARHTDAQLAAAGVRATPSRSPSPDASSDDADEHRLARDDAPPTSRDLDAPPARPSKAGRESSKRSKPEAEGDEAEQNRVAAKKAPSRPSRSRDSSTAPGVAERSQPEQRSTGQRQRSSPSAPERSIVRTSAVKEPTRTAAKKTALFASPASNAEATDDPPGSWVRFKRPKKDKQAAATRQTSFEERAETRK